MLVSAPLSSLIGSSERSAHVNDSSSDFVLATKQRSVKNVCQRSSVARLGHQSVRMDTNANVNVKLDASLSVCLSVCPIVFEFERSLTRTSSPRVFRQVMRSDRLTAGSQLESTRMDSTTITYNLLAPFFVLRYRSVREKSYRALSGGLQSCGRVRVASGRPKTLNGSCSV